MIQSGTPSRDARRADPWDPRLASVLADASPDGLIALSPDGRVLFWNQGAESIFGYPREEAVGRSALDLIIPDDRIDETHQLVAETLATGSAARESIRRRQDGSLVHVDVTTRLVRDADDGVLVMSAIRDISERKLAQEALEEKTRALQAAQEELVRKERLAVLGQLAGGVSHELRNPLGVIKNAVYYLNLVLPEDPRVRKYLGIVEREIAAADRIVTGLLDFARVSPSNRAAMDVNAMVREYLGRKPPPDNVGPVVDLADELPLVVGDAGQIELIFGNLMTNAVQAMPDGGTLTVETGAVDGKVRVAVSDTGIGIRVDDFSKIFEPLFTTKAKGIGLGLSVARRLAVDNGATLSVRSSRGNGSCFELRFDSAQPAN
jgi:PAS domain S-box-containing protein